MLTKVADILVEAQVAILEQFRLSGPLPRRLYEAVASALGMTPVATFKAELRQQFLNGLKNAGQNACATQLQATFDQNP